MLKMLIPKNAFDDGCPRTYGIINEICSTCYLPAGPDRKIFSRGFKNCQGRKQRDVFTTEGKYFSVRNDQGGHGK